MTMNELDGMAYAIREQKKKKGAGKGYKISYEKVWGGRISRREYLTEFARIDRIECGLFLCKVEHHEMTSDRYWDVPSYREEAIREYRERIRRIRAEYGLSKKQCEEFMRVA